VPGADEAVPVLIKIDHREERRRKASIARAKRKVFLMVAHHSNQDLLGKFEERGREVAGDDSGVLIQVNHEIRECLIFVDAQAAAG
jgi:hypothetical protein